MADRLDCCVRCRRPWSMCERDPWEPDQCAYCAGRLTEDELSAMAEYFGESGADAPQLQPQTR